VSNLARKALILQIACQITDLVCESELDTQEAHILLTVLKESFEKTYRDLIPLESVQ
jgi:hypothetical protein